MIYCGHYLKVVTYFEWLIENVFKSFKKLEDDDIIISQVEEILVNKDNKNTTEVVENKRNNKGHLDMILKTRKFP